MKRAAKPATAKPRRKSKRKMSEKSLAFFAARKAGLYGRGAHIKCDGCGVTYEAFRGMHTFATARREIIVIDVDKRTGKKKYGRRNGTLGYMRETKLLAWKSHLAQCESVRRTG